MDKQAAQSLLERLEQTVREQWSVRDPDVQVWGKLQPDGKIDLTVVSRLFEDKDGLEREAFFWPVFHTVPRSDLLHMTYCLLLTPNEAANWQQS